MLPNFAVQALRLLRAAEGLCRSAVAVLQAPAPVAPALPAAVGIEVGTRRPRPRGKHWKRTGAVQEKVPEQQGDTNKMEVDTAGVEVHEPAQAIVEEVVHIPKFIQQIHTEQPARGATDAEAKASGSVAAKGKVELAPKVMQRSVQQQAAELAARASDEEAASWIGSKNPMNMLAYTMWAAAEAGGVARPSYGTGPPL